MNEDEAEEKQKRNDKELLLDEIRWYTALCFRKIKDKRETEFQFKEEEGEQEREPGVRSTQRLKD